MPLRIASFRVLEGLRGCWQRVWRGLVHGAQLAQGLPRAPFSAGKTCGRRRTWRGSCATFVGGCGRRHCASWSTRSCATSPAASTHAGTPITNASRSRQQRPKLNRVTAPPACCAACPISAPTRVYVSSPAANAIRNTSATAP